jgi:translation initiation factor IF-2
VDDPKKVREISPFFIDVIFINMNINEIIKKVLREEFLNDSVIYEDVFGSVEEVNFLNEAEYQGRKVQLGKIMQGDIKKFKVYVKNDKGKVVKVNFGFGGKSAKGKRMVIKKNNPERRRSFRARMNCDNPGPRWKPRYWACRTWKKK